MLPLAHIRARAAQAQRARQRLILAIAVVLAQEALQPGLRLRDLVPIPDERLELAAWSDSHFKEFCRFDRHQLQTLYLSLALPTFLILSNRSKVHSFEALVLLCARYSNQARLHLLVLLSGREYTQISRIVTGLSKLLWERWAAGLLFFNHHLMTPERCEASAAGAVRVGSPFDNISCLIDATVRRIARPGQDQRQYYSGHKRIHAVKVQAVVSLDGLFLHLFPSVGRRADMSLVHASGIVGTLQQHLKGAEGRQMLCYGDLGYPAAGGVILSGFRNALVEEEREFNREMSKVRISVEWAFEEVTRLWAHLDRYKLYKPGRSRLRAVIRPYILACFLTNCRLTLNGSSRTTKHFSTAPPSLEEYLESLRRCMTDFNAEYMNLE